MPCLQSVVELSHQPNNKSHIGPLSLLGSIKHAADTQIKPHVQTKAAYEELQKRRFTPQNVTACRNVKHESLKAQTPGVASYFECANNFFPRMIFCFRANKEPS